MMARTKSSGKNRLQRIRHAILRDWRGGDDPEPLAAKTHRPEEFLDTILQATGAGEGINEERLREAWQRIAGDMIAKNTSPESLKNGCLTLKVLQPAMRFQLEQTKAHLLTNLERELGSGVVKSIRLQLG